LLARGAHADAAAVIEQHRDRAEGDERAERELELAGLYLEHLRRPVDALASARRVLEARPRDVDAVGVLERLLEHPETRAEAASSLEREYEAVGDARRRAAALR